MSGGAIAGATPFGAYGITTWTCIKLRGTGPMACFDGAMYGKDIARVYQNQLSNAIKDQGWRRWDVNVQQDNAPIYPCRSRYVRGSSHEGHDLARDKP